MKDNFDACLKSLLVWEGGNDDDPHDQGGRTSRGIIQREYNAFCRLNGLPQGDVWKCTDTNIRAIYAESYWKPWCDQLPAGVDMTFFDMSVLQGPHEATVLLQRGLGVKDDGRIGQVTLYAIAKADDRRLISAIADSRLAFFRSLHTFKYYGKGWTRRTLGVKAESLAMIQGVITT